MRKKKIYLETSVINFVYADDAPDRKNITIRMLETLKNKAEIYETYVSDLVIEEINKAEDNLESYLKL